MNGYDASAPDAEAAYRKAIEAAPNREVKRVLRLLKRAIDAAPAAGLELHIAVSQKDTPK